MCKLEHFGGHYNVMVPLINIEEILTKKVPKCLQKYSLLFKKLTLPSIIYKKLVSRFKITDCISITNTSLLKLFSEMIATCENHMKHINTFVNSVTVLLLQQLVGTELNYCTSITLCHPGM